MGTLTVRVKDDVEKKFRNMAGATYGGGKGHLGKAVTEAMIIWTNKEAQTAEMKSLEMLEEGVEMGRLKFKKREELHERSL